MTAATRSVGEFWESASLAHLQRAGLEPLARNFSCRYGEIDLIMRDRRSAQGAIVFVEVRYRNSDAHGDGLASVGAAKREKLLRAAALYLQANPKFADEPCRFDIVGCSGTPQHPSLDWIRNAFDAS